MKVVDKQVQAYNERDLEAFLTCYSEDIKVYMLQSGNVLADGKDNLKSIMAKSFEDLKNSRTEVMSTITQGNLIVNHEKILNHAPGKIIYTISIFEVQDNLITQLWFGGRTVVDL